MGNIPEGKWLPKLHAALDTDTKLTVREVFTNPDTTYQEAKAALLGQTNLSFSAASEAVMTLDEGKITKMPLRQGIQRMANFLEKATEKAPSWKESFMYGAVVIARYFMQPELKTYLDFKGIATPDEFFKSTEEWKRTHPGRPVWEYKTRGAPDRQMYKMNTNPTRKPGDCFYCGKPGHYAQDCRSRLNKEKFQNPSVAPTSFGVKREPGVDKYQQQKPISEVTCFTCRQKGHISPNCPKKSSKVKRIKVREDKIECLRKNEVFGAVGPNRMPVTLDTGAEVTVVPAEAVKPHQLSGETKTLRSFNNGESIGNVCTVDVSIGDKVFKKQAVTQPGESLGWSVCLSMDLTDSEERTVLMDQIARRAEMPHRETLYVPPEVRDGILVSGIPVSEAKVVKAIKSKDKSDSGENRPLQAAEAEAQLQEEVVQLAQDEGSEGPVQSTTVEAQEDEGEVISGDEVDDDEDVVNDLVEDDEILVKEEEAGSALGGSAEPEGSKELPVATIREGMPRNEMAQETTTDVSLNAIVKLAQLDREGYHISQGLVFRTRLDMFGKPVEQLCVPTSYRQKCLQAAHTGFGHQGRNKMITLLRPHFYWPCMARDCIDFVRNFKQCQVMDKAKPKPVRMKERLVVTQPFRDVAVDIVGPFPTAKGRYRFMLTCIDSASRWPEALPIRTTTARVVIKCLTSIFTRWGFPKK